MNSDSEPQSEDLDNIQDNYEPKPKKIKVDKVEKKKVKKIKRCDPPCFPQCTPCYNKDYQIQLKAELKEQGISQYAYRQSRKKTVTKEKEATKLDTKVMAKELSLLKQEFKSFKKNTYDKVNSLNKEIKELRKESDAAQVFAFDMNKKFNELESLFKQHLQNEKKKKTIVYEEKMEEKNEEKIETQCIAQLTNYKFDPRVKLCCLCEESFFGLLRTHCVTFNEQNQGVIQKICTDCISKHNIVLNLQSQRTPYINKNYHLSIIYK